MTISICCELLPSERAVIDLYEQIGGGWSESVPFDCTDACGPVTVEILVMDYWCNWSKAWTDVWVEDKTPVTVAKDVVDGRFTVLLTNRIGMSIQVSSIR